VTNRFVAGVLGLILAGAGCSLIPGAQVPATPCAVQFADARCEAILVWVADELGVQPDQVASIAIVPATPGPLIGHDAPLTLLVGMADLSTRELAMHCFGVSGAFLPRCMAEPKLEFLIPGNEGYRDFPENSTPVPAVDPAAADAAIPLDLRRVDIPIDRTGEQRVVLGQASLANGILREVTAGLEDPWPDSVLLRSAIVLEIRPVGGGEAINNIYVHGWRPGVEPVEVSIAFNAAILRPGAHLTLLNVLVR
jgi:hypothetical protein